MSEFRKLFSKAKHIAIITGAGVSAESGVPTFRGENEKWRKWQSQVISSKAKHTYTHTEVYGAILFIYLSIYCLFIEVRGLCLVSYPAVVQGFFTAEWECFMFT